MAGYRQQPIRTVNDNAPQRSVAVWGIFSRQPRQPPAGGIGRPFGGTAFLRRIACPAARILIAAAPLPLIYRDRPVPDRNHINQRLFYQTSFGCVNIAPEILTTRPPSFRPFSGPNLCKRVVAFCGRPCYPVPDYAAPCLSPGRGREKADVNDGFLEFSEISKRASTG